MKVKTVGEVLMGPKHKAAERYAMFDPGTNNGRKQNTFNNPKIQHWDAYKKHNS